jgi:hypothetical protein
MDWKWLDDQMRQTSWSADAHDAGSWALSELSSNLGPRWPPSWRTVGSAPPEIINSFSKLSGLAGTIRLALAFTRMAGCDGLASVAKELKRGTDGGRFASPRLQLIQGALARSAGYEVRLEPLLKGTTVRADLEIGDKGESVVVEAFALLRDKKTIDASVWLELAREDLRILGDELTVDFSGQILEPLAEADTESWLTELRVYARLCAQGADLPPLRRGGVTVSVEPTQGPGGATRFAMPRVSFRERLGKRLQEKAVQTARSGANWLLIDSFDNLWHMTGWSHLPLAQKAEQLANLLRHELRESEHILGVTISDGAALMRPGVPEQTVEGDTYFALARRSDAWHIRESVIVPIRPGAKAGVKLWLATLEAESEWIGHELRRQGLLLPTELAPH